MHSVEELNTFFADAGSVDGSIDEDVTDLTDKNFDDRNFYFKYVTPAGIKSSLGKIKSDAIGMDGISSKLIKMTVYINAYLRAHY